MSGEKTISDEDRRMIRRRLGIEPYKIPNVAVVNYLVKKKNRVLIGDHIKVIEEFKPDYSSFTEGVVGDLEDAGRIVVFTGMIDHELLLSSLCKTNVKVIYAFGLAGALQQDLKIGDIVIPTVSIRGEGLTDYYAPKGMPAAGNLRVLSSLAEGAIQLKIPYKTGCFYTTSSIVKEPEYITKWSSLGVLGIEMELARHYLLSHIHGKMAGALYVISDSPIKGDKIWVNGIKKQKIISQSISKCTDILIQSIRRFSNTRN